MPLPMATDEPDDYYALLNVSRDATPEVIRQAYRQLSRMYHPDKHREPQLQELASHMFPRIQRAYEVLSDDQTRAVYDAYGAEGLDAGKKIAPYYNTTAEMRAMFEMERRKKEHEEHLNTAAPKGMMSLSLDATRWFRPASATPFSLNPFGLFKEDTHDDSTSSDSAYFDDDDDDDDDDELSVVGVLVDDVDDVDDDMDTYYEDMDDYSVDDDADEFLEETERESMFGGIKIKTMQIEQEVQSRIDENNTLKFVGTIATGKKASGKLGCTWDHLFSPTVRIQSTISVGSQTFGKLKIEKTLQKYRMLVFGEIAAATANVKSRQIVAGGFTTGLIKRITDSITGLLHWKIGIDSSLTATFLYTTKDLVTNLSCRLTKDMTSISLEGKHPLTENTSIKGFCSVSAMDVVFGYGLKRKISEHTSFGLSLNIGINSGVMVQVKFVTTRQAYVMPVLLSEMFSTSAVVTGTLVPIFLFYSVRNLAILPYLAAKERARVEERRRAKRVFMKKKKKEAESAVLLMKQSVERKVAAEERVQGLVIVQAWYGKLVSSGAADGSNAGNADADDDQDVIDVTVPLQCLVHDSKLVLQDISKAHLVGFYDPCPEIPKQLRIVYRFQNALHEVVVGDEEKVSVPRKAHRKRQ